MVTVLSSPSVAALIGKDDSIQTLAARRSTLIGALSRADVILSPSHFLRDQVVRAGFPADRILVSRYGIDARPVQRAERRTDDPLRVGYLGQIAPHKGVHILIEAARHLPSAALDVLIYGDPAPHPRYTRRLRRLATGDTRISFQGTYQHDSVYRILANLDVVVVPSVWYENAPFVIQEAQAAGVPVLASRLGGMRELVAEEQGGLLFEPGNAHDLAVRLQRILQDPALLERLRPDISLVRTADHEMQELLGHYRRLQRG
jgi:glycosyltransferase involved in cell wall biosynthesis